MPPSSTNAYSPLLTSFYSPEEELALLDLSMPDDKLLQMLRISLDSSRDYWNQSPWNLQDTDARALPYIFNERKRPSLYQVPEEDYSDNRLFRGMRSIVAYATGRLAMPELSASSEDDYAKRQVKLIALALYQHSLDDHVDVKVRAMVLNHLFRKRSFLKLRFDPMAGVNGDIVTDNVAPEDLVMDQYATYLGHPLRIHQRVRSSLDELCAKYPKKADGLYQMFGIKQGRYSQLSREVTSYESWYTYLDKDGYPREGVAWWISDPGRLVLDKQPNPNWIYTGDDQKDRQINLLSRPPKPFPGMNYLNLGRSAIDETSLFDHALPQQVLLDKRQRQWHKNIDYVNGRWVADKNKLTEGEATKMVNKGSKTIGMIDNKEGRALDTIIKNLTANPLGSEVYQSILDTRNEIDELLGVNSIFKGSTPGQKDTLGRDLLQNQQASSLQDDLVKSVSIMMQQYYAIKLQLARVNWTEDQTIQTKGADGNDMIITLSGATIDPNIKIGVQTDSIYPVNKAQLHQDAKELFTSGKMDALSAFQDMGYNDADVRAERLYKSQTDPLAYQASIERGMDNNQAEQDIQRIINGTEPEDRDQYDQDYLDYYNLFITTGRFRELIEAKPEVAQEIIAHLSLVQHTAAGQAELQMVMLNESGMLEPAPMPAPVVPGQEAPPTGNEPPTSTSAPQPLAPTGV